MLRIVSLKRLVVSVSEFQRVSAYGINTAGTPNLNVTIQCSGLTPPYLILKMPQNFGSERSFCAGLVSEPRDLEISAPLSESSDAEPGCDNPRKKRRLNPELWDYSRSPKGSEQLRDKHYHEIYYCKLCEAYRGSPNAQRFREHLARKHRVYVGKTLDSR